MTFDIDTPTTAWDLIGFPNIDGVSFDHMVRIKGGRTLYEAVAFNDSTPGTRVRLDRLDTSDGLRVINRYVDPDTELEVVVNG